jgi:hypothetical protein
MTTIRLSVAVLASVVTTIVFLLRERRARRDPSLQQDMAHYDPDDAYGPQGPQAEWLGEWPPHLTTITTGHTVWITEVPR